MHDYLPNDQIRLMHDYLPFIYNLRDRSERADLTDQSDRFNLLIQYFGNSFNLNSENRFGIIRKFCVELCF